MRGRLTVCSNESLSPVGGLADGVFEERLEVRGREWDKSDTKTAKQKICLLLRRPP